MTWKGHGKNITRKSISAYLLLSYITADVRYKLSWKSLNNILICVNAGNSFLSMCMLQANQWNLISLRNTIFRNEYKMHKIVYFCNFKTFGVMSFLRLPWKCQVYNFGWYVWFCYVVIPKYSINRRFMRDYQKKYKN